MAIKKYNFSPPGFSLDQKADVYVAEKDSLQIAPGFINKLNNRIANYSGEGLMRELVDCSNEDLATDALKMDLFKEKLPPMVKVTETGGLLSSPQEVEQARVFFQNSGRAPREWAAYLTAGEDAPFPHEKTRFINYFGEDVVVLIDMHRPPWKQYYTSDVFFSQWLRMLDKEQNVQHLPDHFPKTLYINNITNVFAKRELKKLLNRVDAEVVILKPGEIQNWALLKNTPSLKCVQHILDDFNRLKGYTSFKQYRMETLQCYRKDETYNLKMRIRNGENG